MDERAGTPIPSGTFAAGALSAGGHGPGVIPDGVADARSIPGSSNLLLQGADGLQFPLGLRRQVIGRVARFVFPFRRPGVQFGQAGMEPRGQGIQFDHGLSLGGWRVAIKLASTSVIIGIHFCKSHLVLLSYTNRVT